MCRKPEIKVTTDTESPVTDVSLFVEELNLPQSAEEMESVSNTFHGVENLGGIGNWEGLYFQSAHTQFQQNNWKRVNPIKVILSWNFYTSCKENAGLYASAEE